MPRYELAVRLDTTAHTAEIRQRVTWTNTTRRPVADLAFNFYPHYIIPPDDERLFANTLEMLRVTPSHGLDRKGHPGRISDAVLVAHSGRRLAAPVALRFEYDAANRTTLRFPLPDPVGPGETVTVELGIVLQLPNKQGRWGHWQGVTYLTNALPLLAFCDDTGWRPMPFIAWHQPWFNEAGVFTARITLPADETLVCPAVVKAERVADGWKTVEFEPFVGRDFSFLASKRYREFRATTQLPDGRTLPLRCFAFAEHEWYANEMLKIVGEAIPAFSDQLGPFPHAQFTVAESYFGWNGNECAGLVLIDERVFGMPKLMRGYVEYLVAHEVCHQWWYNLIGTNGYAEPFMDEGAAVHFTHRYMDRKRGKNNAFADWPAGFEWMPNIRRDNYRFAGMHAAVRNGHMQPAAQPLAEYGHLSRLFTGAYDRGSKAFGMIEDRLGEAAFLDFTRGLVAKYRWRVLQAADLRAELEAYTGRDWGEFFDRWVYGRGLTDWAVESVTAGAPPGPRAGAEAEVSVVVRQSREFTEPTVVGFTLPGGRVVRVPLPAGESPVSLTDPPATVAPLGDGRWRLTARLPAEPTQIEVDPDRVLLDAEPGNNRWKQEFTVRVTPVYSLLDETDLTSDYDRWNFIAGPWVWGVSYPDPWYTRSTMVGLRVGANRPNVARGGVYGAFRTDYRDLVAGADLTVPLEMAEIGLNYERRIGGPYGDTDGGGGPQRASAYYRWVLRQSSSLYLPPVLYHEAYTVYSDNFLPIARQSADGAVRPDQLWNVGWHLRGNLYTPYWDPEMGGWVDVMVAGGQARVPEWVGTAQGRLELAGIYSLPEGMGRVRFAGRAVGQMAFPDRGQFFALGGGTLFRGYDLAERQGSALWVANAELRVPIVRHAEWDTLDHLVGVRSLTAVAFYDVGEVYVRGRGVGGGVAHALGAGL
ncbi:MAG TPA: M1 family aminopeptidase, partial [Urbifossiella sp.]|nr:M1 family aminopeptidase [Urbifossiella sp.]